MHHDCQKMVQIIQIFTFFFLFKYKTKIINHNYIKLHLQKVDKVDTNTHTLLFILRMDLHLDYNSLTHTTINYSTSTMLYNQSKAAPNITEFTFQIRLEFVPFIKFSNFFLLHFFRTLSQDVVLINRSNQYILFFNSKNMNFSAENLMPSHCI